MPDDAKQDTETDVKPLAEEIRDMTLIWNAGRAVGFDLAALSGVIAKHDAAVASQALIEAADALGNGPTVRVLVERESCDWWQDRPVAAVLRERAQRLSRPGASGAVDGEQPPPVPAGVPATSPATAAPGSVPAALSAPLTRIGDLAEEGGREGTPRHLPAAGSTGGDAAAPDTWRTT